LKIKLISFNKARESWVVDAISDYLSRLKRYVPVSMVELDAGRKSIGSPDQLKKEEAIKLLAQVKNVDYLVLLDLSGKKYSSTDWANWIEKRLSMLGSGDLIFVAGGAYGFHDSVYDRAQELLSLSEMTFTHQMVKVIFLEQLYRSMTILRNEPYHH
jgi:23S rRNA (pseudouridine1915-N3)-methyltransferase